MKRTRAPGGQRLPPPGDARREQERRNLRQERLTTPLTILEAMADKKWFKTFFQGPSWDGWKAFLAAVFGLAMTAEMLKTYQEFTGRQAPPNRRASEAWMIVGRRGGKTRISALIAVYLAIFRDYGPHLAPGEMATIPIMSSDVAQTRQALVYIKAMINQIPAVRAHVTRELTDSVLFNERVLIEVHAANYKSARGYTVVTALCDEIAFWMNDETSKNPDTEIIAAIKPGMLTIPGALLLGMSSPYARKGVLWEAFEQHYGHEGDPILVWKAATLQMNQGSTPTARRELEEFIQTERDKDEVVAAAEYDAEFRRDLADYVSLEVVRACTVAARGILLRVFNQAYYAFCDPSGGEQDSFTLAIGHKAPEPDGARVVIDWITEVKAPFNPKLAVGECVDALNAYGCGSVHGDHYGGQLVRSMFMEEGITYLMADKPKSEYYVDLMPLLSSRMIELPDPAVSPEGKRLRAQLLGLERRTGRSGKDSIDHAPGAHDDVANAVAGLAAYVAAGPAWHSLDISTGNRTPADLLKEKHPFQQQIEGQAPQLFEKPGSETCGSCIHKMPPKNSYELHEGLGLCEIHNPLSVKDDSPQCEWYERRRGRR